MERSEFVARLDETLDVAAYEDVDASPNGLQVGAADGPVDHVAVAVDAATATIETAAAAGADCLITHHGLVWGSTERITGRDYDRFAPLFTENMALYVAHLPLDGHQQLGNAAGIADVLELTDREPFGEVGGVPVGQRGTAPEAFAPTALVDELEVALDTGDGDVRLLDAGPDRIEDVAIVTGAGGDYLDAAAAAGCDALITGEWSGREYHAAREAGINVVYGGHYATETFGVRRVADRCAEWGLETTYVDHPTGL